MKSIYQDYKNKEELQNAHGSIVNFICQDDALLHEIIHVYICAAFKAATNKDITTIKL